MVTLMTTGNNPNKYKMELTKQIATENYYDKYLGGYCKEGHSPPWRYTKTDTCVVCKREYTNRSRCPGLSIQQRPITIRYYDGPNKGKVVDSETLGNLPQPEQQSAPAHIEHNPQLDEQVTTVRYLVYYKTDSNGDFIGDLTKYHSGIVANASALFCLPDVGIAPPRTRIQSIQFSDGQYKYDQIVPVKGYIHYHKRQSARYLTEHDVKFQLMTEAHERLRAKFNK